MTLLGKGVFADGIPKGCQEEVIWIAHASLPANDKCPYGRQEKTQGWEEEGPRDDSYRDYMMEPPGPGATSIWKRQEVTPPPRVSRGSTAL